MEKVINDDDDLANILSIIGHDNFILLCNNFITINH